MAIAFLIIVAAPGVVAVASVLALYDRGHRKRWISFAVIAGLVIVVLYLLWLLFIEPRQDSMTAFRSNAAPDAARVRPRRYRACSSTAVHIPPSRPVIRLLAHEIACVVQQRRRLHAHLTAGAW